MNLNVIPYVAVSPRIVPSHSEQWIVVRPKYDFVKFSGEYEVSVWPRYRYEYNSEKQGAYYEPFEVCANGNELRFQICFGAEQEYIIQIQPKKADGRATQMIVTSLYALDEDLYHKRVMKGDLHLHTTYSDGLESPPHRAMQSRKEGFDFIAITDHNSYLGSTHLMETMKRCPNNMVFIRGEEVHATGCPVHILSLGASEAIAPKVTKLDEPQQAILSALKEKYRDVLDPDVNADAFAAAMDVFNKIHEAGGISVLCHIYWEAIDSFNHKRMGAPEQLINALVEQCNFDAFEITSGAPEHDLKANYLQEAYYREKLPKDFPIIGITDSHTTLNNMTIFGKNYTIAFVDEYSEEGVISAIRNSQTVSVDGVGRNVICHGSLRLIKYATFLIEHYFPFHDMVVQTEGQLMQRILEGNYQFMDMLKEICAHSIDTIQAEWNTIFSEKNQ